MGLDLLDPALVGVATAAAEPVVVCVSPTNSDAKSLGGSGGFSTGQFLCLNKIDTSALASTFKVNSISVNFVYDNGGDTTYKLACYRDNDSGVPDTMISESVGITWDGVTGVTDVDMQSTPNVVNNNILWLALAIKNTGTHGPDIKGTTYQAPPGAIPSGDCYYATEDYDSWFPFNAPTTTGTGDPNLWIHFCATTE